MKDPKVSEIMTERPVCASPRTPLVEVAQLMQAHDCGAIPIVGEDTFPIGIVTDRDIAIRAVAAGIHHAPWPVDFGGGRAAIDHSEDCERNQSECGADHDRDGGCARGVGGRGEQQQRVLEDFLAHAAEHARRLVERLDRQEASVERFLELSGEE